MQGNDTQIDYGVQDVAAAIVGDNNNNIKLHTKRQIRGAAAVGGIAVGLCFASPVGAVIGAGGAALACAKSKGHAGDAIRASGDVMADVGVKLKRMDRKHRVVEKTSKGVIQGCQWISKKLNVDNNNDNNNASASASPSSSSSSRQITTTRN